MRIADKKQIKEITILRGMAILGVVIIHTTAYFTLMSGLTTLLLVNVYLNIFSHFAVPLFILISGTVLAFNYGQKFSTFSFYKKRIISIILPYLIFSVFYIYAFQLPLPPLKIITKILLANGSYHLWFFIVLTQLYLLHPLLINLYNYSLKHNKIKRLLLMSLLLQIMYNVITLIIQPESKDIIAAIFFYKRIFLSYIFYFILGIHIGKNYEFIKTKIYSLKKINYYLFFLIIIITTILSYNLIINLGQYINYYHIPPANFALNRFIQPILYLLIFIIFYIISLDSVKSNNIISKTMIRLGKHSFGIYLIHIIFIKIIVIILNLINISYNNWEFYPTLFIGSIVLSYLATNLISYLPYGRIIIGSTK